MQVNDDSEQSTSTAPESSKKSSNSSKVNGILGDKMDCDYDESKSSKVFEPFERLASFHLPTAPPAPPLPPHLMSRSYIMSIKYK